MKVSSNFILILPIFLRLVISECPNFWTALNTHPKSSTKIDLTLKGIDCIPRDGFRNYTVTTELYLNNNTISVIPENVFAALTNLKILHINYNRIIALSEKVFTDLTKLEELQMHNNLISEIPPNVFRKLERLGVLYLDGNKISAIYANMFTGLKLLRELHLDWNTIHYISYDAFSEVKILYNLYIGCNSLTKCSNMRLMKYEALLKTDQCLPPQFVNSSIPSLRQMIMTPDGEENIEANAAELTNILTSDVSLTRNDVIAFLISIERIIFAQSFSWKTSTGSSVLITYAKLQEKFAKFKNFTEDCVFEILWKVKVDTEATNPPITQQTTPTTQGQSPSNKITEQTTPTTQDQLLSNKTSIYSHTGKIVQSFICVLSLVTVLICCFVCEKFRSDQIRPDQSRSETYAVPKHLIVNKFLAFVVLDIIQLFILIDNFSGKILQIFQGIIPAVFLSIALWTTVECVCLYITNFMNIKLKSAKLLILAAVIAWGIPLGEILWKNMEIAQTFHLENVIILSREKYIHYIFLIGQTVAVNLTIYAMILCHNSTNQDERLTAAQINNGATFAESIILGIIWMCLFSFQWNVNLKMFEIFVTIYVGIQACCYVFFYCAMNGAFKTYLKSCCHCRCRCNCCKRRNNLNLAPLQMTQSENQLYGTENPTDEYYENMDENQESEYDDVDMNGFIESDQYDDMRANETIRSDQYVDMRANETIRSDQYVDMRANETMRSDQYGDMRANETMRSDQYGDMRRNETMRSDQYVDIRGNETIGNYQ